MVSQRDEQIKRDSFLTRDEFNEAVSEIKAQISAGVLDIGDEDAESSLEAEAIKAIAEREGGAMNWSGGCFSRLCKAFGAEVPHGINTVNSVSDSQLLSMRQSSVGLKVFYQYYTSHDERNHVVAVDKSANSARVATKPAGGFEKDHESVVVGITSAEQFFNRSNMYADVHFFADTEPAVGLAGFGADAGGLRGTPPRNQRRDESIVDDRASSGQANVAGGVKRAKRRVVASKSKFSPSGHVAKSYAASSGLMFNNLNEMFQDTISREYAQEIIEAVFSHWGIPSDEPDSLKYGEDLICAFFIATTASNKADFDFTFPVPCHSGEVDADFAVLSRVLAEEYGITRRQFARGIADDMRSYIKDPDNTHLRPKLADRAGCDPQMAVLAFDGSTHCSGLTSAQLTFTKLLESRNLFEDDATLSQGASQTLMEGIHGRVRSKVQR